MLLPNKLQVLMARTPIDFRKSIDGLSIMIADLFGMNPTADYLFVFRNKHGDKLKILYWDRNGYCLFYKRLERGRFSFPKQLNGYFEVSIQQLRWLLDGLDFENLTGHPSLHYDKHF